MYFERLIEKIKENSDRNVLFANIINPLSMYLICNHFIGDELSRLNIKTPNKNDLRVTNNISIIRDYDMLLVESSYFDIFIEHFLPRINKKIILLTGQWEWPQVYKSDKSEFILNHPNILLWVSQNPIYQNHPKYMAFPYGICHYNLTKYSKQLLEENNKTKLIECLPLNNGTNPCRSKLPKADIMKTEEFYQKMSEAEFMLSPIGDRDDCYRHYECIGLGTIPISNVGDTYKCIFGENMYYCDIDQMVNILNTDSIDCSYSMPNRDLICFEYHRDIVFNKITELKNLYGPNPSGLVIKRSHFMGKMRFI
jgi:hypothetical protein